MKKFERLSALFLVFLLLFTSFLPFGNVFASQEYEEEIAQPMTEATPDELLESGDEEETPGLDENETPLNEEENMPAEEELLPEENPLKEEPKIIEEPIMKTRDQSVTTNLVITENILTDAVLKQVAADGSLIDIPDPMPNPSVEVLNLDLAYTWALPDSTYNSGDTFTFSIPDEFTVFNTVSGDLIDGNGILLGTFSLAMDGTVTMTFNENIEDRDNVHGVLEFRTEIKENLTGNVDQIIRIEIKDGAIVEIPISFKTNVSTSIDKRAFPNASYNTKFINWEVDFNKKLDTITNAVIEDPIQVNQALEAGTIEVYYLSMSLDGTPTLGSLVDSSDYTIGTISGNDFNITFNDPINDAYRLKFRTNITDFEGTLYENEATLKGDEILDVSADAGVTVGRGKTLEKKSTGYNRTTQTINWEIKANYNERTLADPNSTIIDTFDNVQEFVPGSLQIYTVSINPDGSEGTLTLVTTGYTYTETLGTPPGTNGFIITFDVDIDQAYKVNYQTKAVDRVFDGETITNTVIFNGEIKTAYRSISQVIVLKYNNGAKYGEKTIDWQIYINRDGYEMNNIYIDDMYTNQGLTLIPESFSIDGMTAGIDYTLVAAANGFDIVFANTITTPFVVRYSTDFDYEARLDPTKKFFENIVTVNWKDENMVDHSKSVLSRFTPDSYTQYNGYKGGSYNAQTKNITWTVGANYNFKTINNLKVVDYILGEQSLDKDSIVVYEGVLPGGSDTITKGAVIPSYEYALNTTIVDGAGNPGFEITFGSTNKAYIIEYNTSIADKVIVAQYENTVYFKDGTTKLSQIPASVSVLNGGTYMEKTGVQNQRLMDWTVNINQGQSSLTDVVITDHPSPNQVLMKDSFALYPTIVASDGTFSKGSPALIQGTDYNLEFKLNSSNEEYFEISFLNNVNLTYILEYQSYVMDIDRSTVSNNIELTATQPSLPDTSSATSQQVRITSGSGSASGEKGNLTVKKVAGEEPTKFLAGAEFGLYDASGTIKIMTATTDENGEVTFSNVLLDDYQIREIKAPTGYAIHNAVTDVVLDTNEKEITITNDKIIRDVELLKTDAVTDDPLEGAWFTLYRNTTEYIGHYQTDENGKIYVADLLAGNYEFREFIAPPDYQLDTTPVSFIILAEQLEVTHVAKENNIILGSVELTKVDNVDHSMVLEGAVFKLVDAQGAIVRENLTTNAAGKILVENLRPGNYQFVETQAPADYELNARPINITIERSQEMILEIETDNQIILGAVELTKVDNVDPSIVLAGAVFKLVDAQGGLVHENLNTNAAGKILVENLRPGAYQFIEIQAPADYELDATPIDFTIVRSQEALLELETDNQIILGDVELTKVDNFDDSIVLPGAIFKVLDAQGAIVAENLITNAEGKILVENLRPGNYQFVETQASGDYELDATPIDFTIERSQEVTLEIQADNQIILGSVELTKVDNFDDSIVLPGAIFKVVDDQGATVAENLTTNAEGQILVENLRPGDYQFIETQAPTDYELDATPIDFTIERSQEATLEFETDNQIILGDVELTKVDNFDDSIVLPGAIFKVVDDQGATVAENLTTNAEGQILVENLRPGNYQFIETQAPEDYELDATPIDFTIARSQQATLEIQTDNQIILGSVELTKVDNFDDSIVLPGAIFKVLDAQGAIVAENLNTNAEGKILVENLRPGNYQFIETQASGDYELDATPIDFTIIRSQQVTLEIQTDNQIMLGSVELTKVDNFDDSIVLPGAIFKVLDAQGAIVAENFTTNAEGKILVENLRPGNYQFIETQAPAGYELDATPIDFTIEQSQEVTFEIQMDNQIILGSVELTKIDNVEKTIALEGAIFNLLDDQGTFIKSYITNAKGKIRIKNLRPGNYQFVETQAPTDYELNATSIAFEIIKSQETMLKINVENKLVPGEIIFTLTDRDTGNLLVGAEYKLVDEAGNVIQANLITDSNGQIIIRGLRPGNYQLIETKAPKGYVLDPTPISFEIGKSQKEPFIVIDASTNVKDTSKLPQTGEENNWLFPIIGIFALAAGTTTLLLKNKKKEVK
jgi:LPXTG-motif cell wall-anchored protein